MEARTPRLDRRREHSKSNASRIAFSALCLMRVCCRLVYMVVKSHVWGVLCAKRGWWSLRH